MTYVKNKVEALKLWPYPRYPAYYPAKGELPKKYPCVMEYVPVNYGRLGEFYALRTASIPKYIQSPMQLKCFMLGIHAPIKEISTV